MSHTSSKSRFDFRIPVANDPERKELFHSEARRRLRELAAALGFAKQDYDLRSNAGGIAVSGEVTLHAAHLYVQASQLATRSDTGILFRTCAGHKDYVGGQNHFASLDALHEPRHLADVIKRYCDLSA